jgi:hypothetical protein
LEFGHGRYGADKKGLRIRKIWTRLSLWKSSWLLSRGRSRARQGGARLKAPQGHKCNPLGTQGGITIDIQSFYRRHSPENRRHKMRERVGWVRRKDQHQRREGSKRRTPSRKPRGVPKLHYPHLHRWRFPESPSPLCASIRVRWWGNASVHP